ncbi:beta-1,3-galactosyltransferase 5-like [Chelonus insularis]|uniref:beta-1,3-galactosyltransferase 5-like n=1 Tax=Chelonus insularis TaxID=460826 RepID=UPI00158A1EE9|nr:beta-1,3-galactosyltransferase 5-like [Chelonus insularis]XP_034949290.1 beta-1,3-galactosyltransferase 5-like [Chelonus insularis]XP_034949295.1 beta-1,3-galactosyltransferase 5-like [Chelonus insularis]XP_034949296.1 beta-1,3-galactosyltransferase 5-like [Chelonus insularis]
MLDKRRLHGHVSPPYSLGFVIALVFLGCFSFWMLIGCPAEVVVPGYILLVPDNASTLPIPYALNELPSSDETTLINLRNFKFMINHDPCNKTQPLLLILIHSAPSNAAKRHVIRETWGKQTPEVVILFFVGLTEEYQSRIIQEDNEYQDIIQGNFFDAYRNITYKHVMALKWATYYCSSAKYILKLDDDVFVHIPAVLDFLKHDLSPWGARRLILCELLSRKLVKRSWRSKWRVSPLEYPARYYPDYCLGWAILYSPDSVFLLYKEAQKEPYFWIDDVHITGTVARKVNLTHSPMHSLILTTKDMQELIKNPSAHKEYLFGPPNLAEEHIKALYRLSISNSV